MEKRSLSKQENETPRLNEPRHQSLTEQIQQQKAARESTSSTKGLTIKRGDQNVPRHHDSLLELQQSLRKERQRQGDHVAPNSRQGKSNARQPSWWSMQVGHGVSNRGERPDVLRSQSQESLERSRKKIPLRGGGGDLDESSSQQQEVTPNYLMSLANDARALRLRYEILQFKERALGNTSVSDLSQILQRSEELKSDVIEVSKESDRLNSVISEPRLTS